MEPMPAEFYGKFDQKNPVVSSFEQKLNDFMKSIGKATSPVSYSRGANVLFRIWNKYEKLLPARYYQEKLLKVGGFLAELKLYKLALWQCYGRYVQQFGSFEIDDITDINKFKTIFFSGGFETENACLTLHVLQMDSICSYHLVKKADPKLLKLESQRKCTSILKFLRLIMQVALPKEELCWLIFNGTIYIYTICRHLMALALYAKAFEYILWASICMESSVPLSTVRYLRWRATLYTAVCQCYYDCESGILAESFARRALGKIRELSQLETMGSSPQSPEVAKAFREATVKVSVMIFKRAVLESRRKPKGILRPKQRTNYKEMQNLPWPHNATEYLLAEMFNGSAAQFLAISEALSSGNRRVLRTKPPFPAEHEVFDVTTELFLAGLLLLAGGGGNTQLSATACTDPIGGINKSSSLIQLAAAGEDGVSVEAAVRFAKAAFCYENLETFDAIIAPLLNFLRQNENLAWKGYELDLDLLIAMEPFVSTRKPKHGHPVGGNCAIGGTLQPGGTIVLCDNLVILAEAMFAYICTPLQDTMADIDMVVDAVLFLWQKCKTVLQRGNFGITGSTKYLKKMDNLGKWLHILSILQEVTIWCNLADVDPVVMIDITLYSAGLLENLAESSVKSKRKPGNTTAHENQSDTATSTQSPAISMQTEHCAPTNLLMKHPAEQLDIACKMLEKAMLGMAAARSAASSTDRSLLIDNSCIKLEEPIHQSTSRSDLQEQDEDSQAESYKATAVHSLIMDLHLELIQVYYRVAFKLLKTNLESMNSKNRSQETIGADENYDFTISTEADIIKEVKENNVLKALFLMQKVMILDSKEYRLLQEAATLLRKAEAEEKRLYLLSTQQSTTDNKKTDVVPAPILLSRTHNSVIFKPAPFASSKKVHWYCIFGRSATGSILKVRLMDFHLQGTGQEVPALGECLLKVKGLEPNEKYIFAVAAYSEDGNIIGNGIGETTKPILAYYPLPILTAWTYLCQAAYQLGHYPVAKAAFSVLWKHFVSQASPPPSDKWFVSDKTDWCITQKSLNNSAKSLASPILLRSFLGSIFIDSDISCKEGAVFCDSLSDSGPLYNGQLGRLAKCERLLVAIEIAGWINDANQALQAVVQCYGLLAPMIFHRIPSTSVVQILIKCLCVLQAVAGAYRQRKQFGITESLQHMTACVTYHLAKILRCWKEYDLALEVVNIGKEILKSALQETTVEQKAVEIEDDVETTQNKWESTTNQQKLAIENSLQLQVKAMDEGLADLKKEVKTEVLTGNVAPAVIYTTILTAPINTAYNTVTRFRDQNRFLEYFVLLLHRLVREENFTPISKWVSEVVWSIRNRNKILLGQKKTSDKRTKLLKNTAVVVEYNNNPVSKKPKKEKVKLKELLDNFLRNPAFKTDPTAQRKQRDILEKRAKEVFRTQLRQVVHCYLQRKKFNQACINEMPWRSQLNMLLGILCFNSFVKCSEEDWTSANISRYSFLDPDIFTLHNSGALLLDTESDGSETIRQTPEMSLHSLRRNEMPSKSGHGLEGDDGISESTESAANTPLTQITTEESDLSPEEPGKPITSTTFILDQLNKAFLHFRRSVVLAHRGRHWTALQNACRLLWNCAHIAMMYITGMDLANKSILTTAKVKNDVFSVPSCVGDISDDEGGFNLKFEQPFDDVNVVDLHLVCAVVQYSIELLCNQKKWESLVYLAIYFNAVTHERYTQKVTPLLVYAQNQLRKRISEYNGPPPPQPHFVEAAVNSGTIINCRNFIGKQLIVTTSLHQDGHFDLNENVAFSGDMRTNALVSVPVDVMDTLRNFRETLAYSKYDSCALKHSRKLLALLLAYTQQRRKDIMKHLPGTVGFSASPTHAENSKPADLSNEDFLLFDNILCKPLPWSQVSLVISSYDHTIELLRVNGQNSLCAQALHEQGNLHFCAGNRRAAFTCWCQAIDAVLNMTDFINNWQHLESSNSISLKHSKDYSEALLNRAGIWGCLQAGILSAKIAEFITSLNFSFRHDCCILSSFFFQGLFRTTFPHPRSDHEYASYEIGFDCEVVELIPGIDLLSDRFRADIRAVVGSLNFLLHELHSAKQNLKTLPLFTLYQYFVNAICRDVHRSVEGRILKVRVLTDLGLFAEAFEEQFFLLNGKKIPHTLLGGFRTLGSKVQMKFDHSSTLISNNLLPIEDLLKTTLSPTLDTLYGPYLVNKLELARTYLVIKLAETINQIPESENFDCEKVNITKPAAGERVIDLDTEDALIITEFKHVQSKVIECQPRKDALDLHSIKYKLTLAQLKDIILSEAQNKLKMLMDKLKKEPDSELANLAPAELEMAIDAKCQAAAIAFQRMQLAFSAAIALSAIQLLQRARILVQHKQNITTISSSALRSTLKKNTSIENMVNKNLHQEPHNMEARERLHMGLWLKCRLAMVTALTAQVYGVGLKKDEDGFLETGQLCEEGIEEAKAYGDVETQAEFMLQAILLDLRLGHVKDRIKTVLQNIIDLLNAKQFISPSAHLILAQTILQLSDLRKSETLCISKTTAMQEKINMCLSAQKLILDQLVLLGESVQHQADGSIYSILVCPLKNIYLPHIIVMAKIKLRLGCASAELAICSSKRRSLSAWQGTLFCFNAGLELYKEAASKEINLEAEFLFQKGKVLRQLTEAHFGKSPEAANFLMEAINITYFHDQNLWLIRQSYLELALLYFYMVDQDEKEAENNLKQELGSENKLQLKSGLILVPKQPKKKITGQGRLIEILQYVLKVPPKCKMLAWIGIRAASQALKMLHGCQALTRDNTISVTKMERLVQNELHEYMLLDILASYQDFQTENDELLPSLTTIQGEKVEEEEEENKELAPGENVEEEEQENKELASVKIPNIMAPYRRAAQKLTSVQLLRYNNHLRKLYNISLLPVRSTVKNVNAEVPEHPDLKFHFAELSEGQIHGVNIDFLKCALNDTEDGVHTPVFNTGICLRLELIHSFLKTHLPAYNNTCCAESVPVILYEMFDGSLKLPDFHPEIYTSVFGEYMLTTPGDSYTGQLHPKMSIAVHSTAKELRVQWYLPALAIPPTSCETQKILFLYAYNEKPITLVSLKTSTLTNASCGYKWIHLKRLNLLHKKLVALKQKAEASLQPELPASASIQRSHHRLRQRYSRTDSAMSVGKLSTPLDDMVLNLCREIKELLFPGSIVRPETEVPFDISFHTLDQLEQIFNPEVGYILKHGSLFRWLISCIESD
ncbi:cilia- and flagella-associated protein 54-like isoform X3 [Heterodontus francisci]|uniref:cilia- and flagella-associated protein 54-like isoform X3 n=1 Tax=Heterodontus francisci TaxID=7792 RepID=UPI00355B6754